MYTLQDLSVIVAEPSAMQRRIVRNALVEAGIDEPLETADAAGVLEAVQHGDIDLVVSAFHLPDLTATELVTRLRRDPRGADTAFLLISSETRFDCLDPVRQAGSVGILPKPFTTEELHAALIATLDLVDGGRLALTHADTAALRVLVVDDSPMARRHIVRVLSGMGISGDNIDTAANGREALALLDRDRYDFVVTDYNMPEMDGRELLERIRAHGRQGEVPVLMVTSEHDAGRLAAVQRAGVSALCDKPFEPATVRRLIGGFLG